MALRVTAQYIDVAASGAENKGIRVEAQHVEVAGTVDLGKTIRVEAQHIEVAGPLPSTLEPNLRVESQMVEVAGTNPGQQYIPSTVRVSGWFLEVVRANDHRHLTSTLGTIGSGLATETLQLGAGSQGPSFFEPENTGQVGSRSSLAGGHLVPGKALDATALNDTGELATADSVLNKHMILAFGANTLAPGEKFADGNNAILATDQADVQISISLNALSDIDIDGTWTQTATSSIKSMFAEDTLTMGTTGDHNFKFGNATSTLSMSVDAKPGLFVLFANNTLNLQGADADSGIDEGFASSVINLSQSADKLTPVITIGAETDIDIDGTWTQTAENQIVEASASNTMALAQDVGVAGPLDADADNTIAATDQADGDLSVFGRLAISDMDIDLNWTQTADSSIRNLDAITPDPLSDDPGIIGSGFTEDWDVRARLADTYDLDADNTLVMVSVAPQPTGSLRYFAENDLTLLDFVDNNVKTRAPGNTIALTQEATYFRVFAAFNQITMSVTTEEGFVTLFAENFLNLQHIGRPNPLERAGVTDMDIDNTWGNFAVPSIKNLFAESIIDIQQDINVLRPYRAEGISLLIGQEDDIFIPPDTLIPGGTFGLTQSVELTINPIRNPSHLIPLSHRADVTHLRVDGVDLDADSAIGITDKANLSLDHQAESVIDFLTVTTDNSLNAIDVPTLIELFQDAQFNIQRDEIEVESELILKHSVAYSLVRDTTDCDYTPFVSDSDADTVPPRPILPEARQPALEGVRFRLTYPPFDTGPTEEFVDLRAPDFGNREAIGPVRVNRESQGGTLTIFADPIWPEVHTLSMSFKALKQEQARGLLNFIERYLGQEIGIYDYEGRVWKGIITNPDEAVTQDGRESYSAQIEFEAERVHQLNRVAQTNLGVTVTAGQDEALAFSTISATSQADYALTPVAPGDSAIDIDDSSDYTIVPAAPASSPIPLSGFATRNSFFYESASSVININQIGADLDFDDFGDLIHNWDAENTTGNSGDDLVSWSDLGSSPVQLNSTAGQRPVVRDNILGGRRVVEFRHSVAAQRMLSASEVPLWDLTNKTGTIFLVFIVREALSAGNETVMGNNTDKIFLGGSTSTQRPVALLSGEGTVALETPQSVIANGSTQLLVLKRSGNNLSFRRNKVDQDGTTFSTNPAPGDEELYFGGFSGAGNSVDLDMAHCLIYDDALSDEDIVTIEGLLSAKWGV